MLTSCTIISFFKNSINLCRLAANKEDTYVQCVLLMYSTIEEKGHAICSMYGFPVNYNITATLRSKLVLASEQNIFVSIFGC